MALKFLWFYKYLLLLRIKRNSMICYLPKKKPCMVLNQVRGETTASERQMITMSMEMDQWLPHPVECRWEVQLQSSQHLAPILGAKIRTSRKWEGFLLFLSTLWPYQKKIPCRFHLFVVLSLSLLLRTNSKHWLVCLAFSNLCSTELFNSSAWCKSNIWIVLHYLWDPILSYVRSF